METSLETPITPEGSNTTKHKLAFGLAFATIGVILLSLFLLVLKMNHGVFTYTLDDPYIHLALSEQLRHGNYGIHAGQHAAPCSSILFPFLLAVAAGSALHLYVPLILNVLALFCTIEIIRRLFLHLELAQDHAGTAVLAGAAVLMAICLGIVGIVFTGLEHSLHVAVVAAIVYGLAIFLDTRRMPFWLPAAIVLCPLLRYEGVPISLAALLVLALRGRWRIALITGAATAVLLSGFSLFLLRLGLPPLPGSVLVKSGPAASIFGGEGGLLRSFLSNASDVYTYNIGLLLLLAAVAAAACLALELLVHRGEWTSRALMALVPLTMVAGHTLAGQFGWSGRYGIYILTGLVLSGIYLAQATIRKVLAEAGSRRLVLVTGAAVALSIIGAGYAVHTVLIPLAANNVYEQQWQMHRFVNDFYHGPVAVNDVGLVSYRNPDFVLDLVGLASENVRILNAQNSDIAATGALITGSGVHLLILYDEWFQGAIPPSWPKVGTMELSLPASPSQKERSNSTRPIPPPRTMFGKSFGPSVRPSRQASRSRSADEVQTRVRTRTALRLFAHAATGRAASTRARSTVIAIGVRSPCFTPHQ